MRDTRKVPARASRDDGGRLHVRVPRGRLRAYERAAATDGRTLASWTRHHLDLAAGVKNVQIPQ